MNSQARLAIPFFTLVALGAAGVVHMTSLPAPGAVGVDVAKDPSFQQRRTAENLRDSVVFQCEDIGRRSARFSPQQAMFMDYLMDTLVANRFDAELFEYEVDGTVHHSVIGRRSGTGTGTLLIGTHHDTYSKSPGANASASGVAAIAEVLRGLRDEVTERSLVVAFFGTGERPYRGGDEMGAQVWLDRALAGGQQIDQAIIVSSFGFFRPGTGGQNSSFPWYLMYPETTDWVGIYGGFGARDEVAEALDVWGRVTDLPARGFASPAWMLGVPSTDQVPFQEAGIPTLLFSDTGGERDPNIGTRNDGPYELPFDEMALRVEALTALVEEYANR